MVVTHSPGNPFAFSPAIARGVPRLGVASDESPASFQHYRSPPSALAHAATTTTTTDAVQRSAYAQKAYEESVAQERLLKDARIEELERAVLELQKKLERAESDKRFLFETSERQAGEVATLKEDVARAKRQGNVGTRELRVTYNALREKHLELEDAMRREEESRAREMDGVRADAANQRRAMETLRADLTLKNDFLEERRRRIDELERQVDAHAHSNAHGESGPDGGGGGDDGGGGLAFVTKELAAAIAKVTALETANTSQMTRLMRMQESLASMAVLKEEKLTLETRLKGMEEMSEALAVSQVRVVQLEQERKTWETLLGDATTTTAAGAEEGGAPVAADIASVLTRQKHDLEAAAIQRALVEEQLGDALNMVSTMREEAQRHAEEVTRITARLEQEQRTKTRLERSKALGLREINFLRDQLKSYDLEEQVESPNFDSLKARRIAELETMLDEFRQELTMVQQEHGPPEPLEDGGAADSESRGQVAVGTKRAREDAQDFNAIERGEYLRKIRALNAELQITRKEDALLRQEMDVLKAAAQTARTTTTTQPRILQHKSNPTSTYQAIRTQTLHDLQLENAALLSELKNRDGDSGGSVVTVPIQSLRNAETALRKSVEEVQQREKRIQRLHQVFRAKSSEFREAVYALLGYKLDFLPNGRVRLTSMYAENIADHAFIFDGEAGTMQSSGERAGQEAFMDAVANLISYWSGERHSIPGMLAALTLELLDKQENQSKPTA